MRLNTIELCALAAIAAALLVLAIEGLAGLRQRALHLAIALDQFVFCAVTLGKAWPGETASSAAWRSERAGRWQGRIFRPLIDTLFRPLERGHCRGAFENERAGKRLPPDSTPATPHQQGD
jgi:hypothetical protein